MKLIKYVVYIRAPARVGGQRRKLERGNNGDIEKPSFHFKLKAWNLINKRLYKRVASQTISSYCDKNG